MTGPREAEQLATLLSLHRELALETDVDVDLRRMAGAFTVIREAATNAVKSSRARSVALDLTDDATTVVGLVGDDGAGFDVDATLASYSKRGSLGLLQMREAARLIGAQLSIDSSPGNGTRVRLAIPRLPRSGGLG
jgi:signal transduction histidine kinase